MPPSLPPLGALPGVADVQLVKGPAAPDAATPSLLVEAPHGATERADYDSLRARLVSALPEDLHEFFFVNTDVGSWEYGLAVARELVARDPQRSALVIRCRIPRTFVDVNRTLGSGGGELAAGQLTAAIPSYVRAPEDHALLGALHRRYTELVARAYELVCGAGGYALVAHTYGPRSLGIDRVDHKIVEKLRWAHEPARVETWPLRAELDLLTRAPAEDARPGTELAPPGLAEALIRRYAARGLTAVANGTYCLHPVTSAYEWSRRYPGRLLCTEVRRDLLVERWRWNQAMRPTSAAIERVATPLAEAFAELLRARG